MELGEQSRAVGRPYIAASTELALGDLNMLGHHSELALAHFQLAAQEFNRLGARHKHGQALFGIGRAQAARGAVSTARAALQEALGIFREPGSLGLPEEVEVALNELSVG